VANMLEKIADYDLAPAYRWWQNLPLWAFIFLFLPVVYAPTVVTDTFALSLWKMVPHMVCFGWLFSGVGHLASVSLAYVLARRWKMLFAFAVIVVRVYIVLGDLPQNYAGLIRGYPIVGKYLFMLPIIEIFTALVAISFVLYFRKCAFQENNTFLSPSVHGVYPLVTEQQVISLRTLWLKVPEWMRWIYCWGIIGAPAITFSFALIFVFGRIPLIMMFRLYPGVIYAFFATLVVVPRFGLLCAYSILAIMVFISFDSWQRLIEKIVFGHAGMTGDSFNAVYVMMFDMLLYAMLIFYPIWSRRKKIALDS